MITPFEAMQHAVEIVHSSEHDKNRIAACLVSGGNYIVQTNHRPDILKQHFTPDARIGNSSQFIHAEMACIFNAPFLVEGSSLYITDPMCPNCAKGICESGVSHVYIDHKGMEKDFFIRRKSAFEEISLPLMKQAGIGVSVIYRKEERIENLLEETSSEKQTIKIIQTHHDLETELKHQIQSSQDRSFAMCLTDKGTLYIPEKQNDIEHSDTKYRDDISPVCRLLFHLKRNNLKIQNNSIVCNLFPSSRDIVNAIGYGVKNIRVGSNIPDHDSESFEIANKLKKFGIINIGQIQ